MDPREQFETEAFLRYGAECRRMARLAHSHPSTPDNSGAALGWNYRIERIKQALLALASTTRAIQYAGRQ